MRETCWLYADFFSKLKVNMYNSVMSTPAKLDPAILPDYAPIDASDEIDIAQLEFNLALTVDQRMAQYFRRMKVREEIRKMRSELYGIEIPPRETVDPESDYLPER